MLWTGHLGACREPTVNGSAPDFSGATAGPHLTIDLAAVAYNTRLFADRAAGQLMAVVKADGFGHGACAVARTALANGASWFGVTSLDEAFALRAAGLRAPVLSWLNPVEADFEQAVR
jgi:alanine racemase